MKQQLRLFLSSFLIQEVSAHPYRTISFKTGIECLCYDNTSKYIMCIVLALTIVSIL